MECSVNKTVTNYMYLTTSSPVMDLVRSMSWQILCTFLGDSTVTLVERESGRRKRSNFLMMPVLCLR